MSRAPFDNGDLGFSLRVEAVVKTSTMFCRVRALAALLFLSPAVVGVSRAQGAPASPPAAIPSAAGPAAAKSAVPEELNAADLLKPYLQVRRDGAIKGGVCNWLERYKEALKCYEQALQAEEELKKAGLV